MAQTRTEFLLNNSGSILQDLADRFNPRFIHTKTPEQFAKRIVRRRKVTGADNFTPVVIEAHARYDDGFEMETHIGRRVVRYREKPAQRLDRQIFLPSQHVENLTNDMEGIRQRLEVDPTYTGTGAIIDLVNSALNRTGEAVDNAVKTYDPNKVAIIRALRTAAERQELVNANIERQYTIQQVTPADYIEFNYQARMGGPLARFFPTRLRGNVNREQLLQNLQQFKEWALPGTEPWPLPTRR